MTATRTIGSIATFRKGSGLAKSDLVADGAHPCIHYGELFTRYGAVIDVVLSRTGRDLPVKSEVGDVLMPTSDVTPRGLAKASAIQIADVGLGGDVLIIRPDHAKADSRFLAYVIRYSVNRVLKLVRGSTVYHLYAADMRHFELPSLPLAEQARVADALKDSDDLIDSLERMITKKQAIKQGMMQELLTGRTRLPGFSMPWRTKTLDAVSDINPETIPAATSPSQMIDYISLEDVSRGQILASSRVEFGNAPSRARRAVRPLDVLFGTVRPNLQSHGLYRGGLRKPVVSTGFAVIRARSGLADPQFLFCLVMSSLTSSQVERIIAGSNYPAVSSRDVRMFEYLLPEITEQEAIGAVLADAEAELAVLHARLQKARAVKQGMMQELLTGRTRLPVREAVA